MIQHLQRQQGRHDYFKPTVIYAKLRGRTVGSTLAPPMNKIPRLSALKSA